MGPPPVNDSPATAFERLSRRWQARLLVAVAGFSLGLGLVAFGVLGWLSPWPASARLLVAGLVALACLGTGAAWVRRRFGALDLVARHLDRTVPELEESAALLLVPEDSLATLDRLQQRRVRAAFERVSEVTLPWGLPRRIWTLAAATLVAGALLVILHPNGVGRLGTSGGPGPGISGAPARVEAVAVEVTPPSYTRHPPRSSAGWEASVEEGARVRWRLVLSRPVESAELVSTEGDTVALAATGDPSVVEGRLEARRSFLYQAVLRDPGAPAATGDYHRLTVEPDTPPTITVVTPAARTELPAAQRMR